MKIHFPTNPRRAAPNNNGSPTFPAATTNDIVVIDAQTAVTTNAYIAAIFGVTVEPSPEKPFALPRAVLSKRGESTVHDTGTRFINPSMGQASDVRVDPRLHPFLGTIFSNAIGKAERVEPLWFDALKLHRAAQAVCSQDGTGSGSEVAIFFFRHNNHGDRALLVGDMGVAVVVDLPHTGEKRRKESCLAIARDYLQRLRAALPSTPEVTPQAEAQRDVEATAPASLPALHPILQAVDREMCMAMAKHAPMGNAHEAYAVLLEEVEEVWDEVRSRSMDRASLRKELIQVAAMACRAIHDLRLMEQDTPSPDTDA